MSLRPELEQILARDFSIAAAGPQLSEEQVTIRRRGENATSFLGEALARSALWGFPMFYRGDDGVLRCAQEDFFSFWAARNMIRWTLVALSPLEAARSLDPSRFFAPRLSLQYNGLHQLVLAFMASRGWVYIETVQGLPVVEVGEGSSSAGRQDVDRAGDAVLAKLTRSGRWVFENHAASHRHLWRTLRQLLIEDGRQVPPSFTALFESLLRYEGELMGDILDDGPAAVVRAREDAQYRGYAFDDTAHDRWTNRDYPYGLGLELRVQAFEECAQELLSECIDACREMRATIDDTDWAAVFVHLMSAVMMPPFELLTVDPSMVIHQRAQAVIDLLSRPNPTK